MYFTVRDIPATPDWVLVDRDIDVDHVLESYCDLEAGTYRTLFEHLEIDANGDAVDVLEIYALSDGFVPYLDKRVEKIYPKEDIDDIERESAAE